MPGKHNTTSVAKQMGKRVVTRENTPPDWLDLMAQVRKARIAQGISTREVADKFNTTVSTVSKWERGDRAMHPHDLIALLDFLGLEMVFKEKDN